MAKFFEANFRKGSFTNTITGGVPVVTGTPFITRTSKGNSLVTSSNKYLNYPSSILPSAAFTMVVMVKMPNPVAGNHYGVFAAASGLGIPSFNFYRSGTPMALLLGSSNIRYFTYTWTRDWHLVIVTVPGNAQTDINNSKCYVDGVELAVSSTISTGAQGDRSTATYLGGGSGGTNNYYIPYIATYDHVFTEAERAAAYKDFLNSYPVVKEKYPNVVNKPMVLRETGLVAAYNMIPNGNVLTDISGNGNNGTIYGCSQTKNGLKIDGKLNYIQPTTALINSNVYSVNCRINTNSTAFGYLFGNNSSSTQYLYLQGGGIINHQLTTGGTATIAIPNYVGQTISLSIVRNGTSTEYIYVNGVRHTLTLASNENWGISKIGTRINNTTASFNGILEDLRVYNRAFTDREAADYHNSFVKPSLTVDFSDESADGVAKVPSGWVKQSGSFCINEAIADDANLKSIKKGTKYLSCLTAGTITIPSKQAYGSWEFDIYKGNNSSTLIHFLSSSKNHLINSYRVGLGSTETIYFSKYSSGSLSDIIYTAGSYILSSSWYRIKITRSTSGIFTLFIKGGTFTPTVGYDGWTLISTTGGGGTNPVTDNTYTTSEYFVLDIDAGDRIANIQLINGIKI